MDAYEFDIPVIGAPMDSVTSPQTAIAMGKLGTVGVLDLEGLWTRYENPEPILEKIASLDPDDATAYLQQAYAEPIKPELIVERLHEIRDAGVTVAGALSAVLFDCAQCRCGPVRDPRHFRVGGACFEGS